MQKEKRSYSIEKNWFPGDYRESLLFCYGHDKIRIQAGLSDDIAVYRDGDNFVILTTNRRLGYAGLDYITYHFNEGLLHTGEIFFQNTDDLDLKKDFFDYTGVNQAKILLQVLMD